MACIGEPIDKPLEKLLYPGNERFVLLSNQVNQLGPVLLVDFSFEEVVLVVGQLDGLVEAFELDPHLLLKVLVKLGRLLVHAQVQIRGSSMVMALVGQSELVLLAADRGSRLVLDLYAYVLDVIL